MRLRIGQGTVDVRGAALGRGAFTSCALLLTLVLWTGCGAGAPAIVVPGVSGTAQAPSSGEESWAVEVLLLTNGVREAHGLPPLQLDGPASEAAYAYAWDMDRRQYFAHENPEGEGPTERLSRHGIERAQVGENLARGHATPAEVVQAWMDSPPHRANLLYPWWTHVGIAVHTGSPMGPWWVAEYFN